MISHNSFAPPKTQEKVVLMNIDDQQKHILPFSINYCTLEGGYCNFSKKDRSNILDTKNKEYVLSCST